MACKASGQTRSIATTVVGAHLWSAERMDALAVSTTKAGGQSVAWRWLADRRAADLICAGGLDEETLRNLAAESFSGIAVDILVQPCDGRRKKALFLDMEATFIEQELLDCMARNIGRYDEVCAITRAGMEGKMDFAESLRKRTSLFKGQPVKLIEDVLHEATPCPGAAELVAEMRKAGAVCVLVSGGFTAFVEPIARQHHFDLFFGNRLVIENGKLTGAIEEPVFDKLGKRRVVEDVAKSMGFSLGGVVCAGDGGNDAAMIDAVNAANGFGVAWRGKAPLAHVPHHIRHSDLRTILYAQGYPAASA